MHTLHLKFSCFIPVECRGLCTNDVLEEKNASADVTDGRTCEQSKSFCLRVKYTAS